jgi:hypothetical protein
MLLPGFLDMKTVLALSLSLMFFCPSFAGDAPAPASERKSGQAGPGAENSRPGTTGGAEPGAATAPALNSEATPASPSSGNAEAKPAGATTANPETKPEVPPTYAERIEAERAAQERKAALEAETRRRREVELKAAASQSRPVEKAPLKLYGRIEELCAVPGAKIPLKMQAMMPIRDTSLDAKLAGKTSTLAGGASTLAAGAQAYPMDYRGSWSGEITINSSNFDPVYYQYDAAEARREAELLRPGTKGRYTVTFYQGANNKIEMQPSQVIFQGTDTMGNQLKVLAKADPGLKGMPGAGLPMMANMQIPIIFAMHLGTPITSAEIGVTGNQTSSELMKSTLKELSKGVLESQIVTREHDRNPETGKVQDGYSESVLRFTRLSNRQLYLQAAHVYYRKDGHFLGKQILYGTLDRSDGQAAAGYPNPANPFGSLIPGLGGANPFGGMPGSQPGGGGNLQEQMKQMQEMLKKMGGK